MNAQDLPAQLMPLAWQSFHRGELAHAEQLGRRVLAAGCAQAETYRLMGSIAYRAGHLNSAIAWMQKAVQGDPANADNQNSLGMLYSHANRPDEAAACYRACLRLRPQSPDAHNNLSAALSLLGQAEEARAHSEQALKLRPDFPEANNHLGLALAELGRADLAAQQFRTALLHRPRFAPVHRNLGKVLAEQGRLTEAVSSFQEALRLEPLFAEAHADLAEAHKQLGRFEEAVAGLRTCLQIKPDYAFAYWVLGQFTTQGLCRLSDDEWARASTLVQSDGLSPQDRSVLHLMLGDVLDHRKDYDSAWAHYCRAAELRKGWLGQTGRGFDPAAHREFVDKLIATFDEAFFRSDHQAGSDSELPVFVVGMPRSGTTLVEQILSSHSRMAGAGELSDLENMAAELDQSGQAAGGFPACVPHLKRHDLSRLAKRYLERLTRCGGSALRVIDKMPENFIRLGLIALMFPHARVIHCRRDPLDVCLSCFFQNFHRVSFSWSLDDLGQYHREYERLMAHWQRVLPLQIHEVRYEDLVARQEEVSRELVSFCGLKWEDRCLVFHKNPRPIRTASVLQVRRPMYSSSIGRWKHYAGHLEPLRRALGLQGPGVTYPTMARQTAEEPRC